MSKSKVWLAPPSNMSVRLHLLINEIRNLPVEMFQDSHGSSLLVQIEWRGAGRKHGFLPKGFKRNCTAKQHIQDDGIVSWNEEFDHPCKLKKKSSKKYRSWIINLEIQECVQNSKGNMSILGKTKLDVAELALPMNETSIRLPINCNIRGHAAEAVLMVKLQFIEFQSSHGTSFTLPRALSLRSFSCTSFPRTLDATNGKASSKQSTILPRADSSSDDELELNYGKLAMTNFFLVDQYTAEVEDNKDMKEMQIQQPTPKDQESKQPSLVRLLSLHKARQNFRAVNHSKGIPLLNKACREDGGDDIDNERRQQSSVQYITPSENTKVEHEESSLSSGFEDDGVFEVGKWEKKILISRDGQMELVADVFLASIDQRSEKAAGGSACTVLAAVIADWLHMNPKIVPIRCQFDDLIREGSSEWRKLCTNEDHKEKFSDQHFDLDTVLEANIRPLSVVTDMSYIGFLSLDNMPKGFEFLEEAMSFDSIWKEMLGIGASEDRIYIVSWNDHFFVLKVESDVVYLIDTLGERLFEGCNQAYILKFNRASTIYRRHKEPECQTEEPKECSQCTEPAPESAGKDTDQNFSGQIFCEGMESCREYIKGFLAAIPLRELKEDIEKGLKEKSPLHRRLQIEFHCTVTCNARS